MLAGVCSGQFYVQRPIQELGEISHGRHLDSATDVTLLRPHYILLFKSRGLWYS